MMIVLSVCAAIAAIFLGMTRVALLGVPKAAVGRSLQEQRVGMQWLVSCLQEPQLFCGSLWFLQSFLWLLAVLAVWPLLFRLEVAVTATNIGLLFGATLLGLALQAVLSAMAKHWPLQVAIACMVVFAGVLWVVRGVLRPVVKLIGRLVEVLGWPKAKILPFWTPEDIAQRVAMAETAHLGKRHADLLTSVAEFSDTVIRNIMVPRTDMVAMHVETELSVCNQIVLEAGHSRIPVYEETIDNILGILHVKDLFIAQHSPVASLQPTLFALKPMLRSTFFVPEIMKIGELLREFQRRKTHMAIVIDEYGGTAGVVTLEDILEEIVGEIQDEYDVDEKQFRVMNDKIVADGRVSIRELEEALHVVFPDDADYETLAGFLMSRSGILPPVGTVIAWHKLRFTIKEANEKRIGMVEIERV